MRELLFQYHHSIPMFKQPHSEKVTLFFFRNVSSDFQILLSLLNLVIQIFKTAKELEERSASEPFLKLLL